MLGTSDYVELVLFPTLVARLTEEAPGIDLRLVPIGEDAYDELARGGLDLFLAPPSSYGTRAGITMRRLFGDRFVCIVREGHPLARKKLTLARYAEARHALISPLGKEGGFVDDALARLGLARRVTVAVPHFLIAPHLVASSDLILTLAQRVAAVLAQPLGLTTLPPPRELALEGFSVAMFWHERTQADPMLQWLRDLLASVARSLRAPGGRPSDSRAARPP